MESIVLFGTGFLGNRLYEKLKMDGITPAYFVDNAQMKWGFYIDGIEIIKPERLKEIVFDAVVICVNDSYYSSVYNQLSKELGISKNLIRHWTYWMRLSFLNYYDQNGCFGVDEIERVVQYIRLKDRLDAFNYPFVDLYKDMQECLLDTDCGLFYTVYKGKKMYLNRSFRTKRAAENYVRSILIEQDDRSPHKYIDNGFTFDGGCLLDAGVAEGNFALEVIEKADKVILVEAEPEWNEALIRTFEPWMSKVVIINKYLSDKDGCNSVTIDTLANEYKIDFIKMDIEGAELLALKGGKEYLKKTEQSKLAVCTYHNNDDETRIREFFRDEGLEFDISATDGYMVFPYNMDQDPRLVRGLLRVQKKYVRK